MDSGFTWPVRVYYEDTDTGGVVFYANYLKFFERARTEWLRSGGIEQSALAEAFGIMFVVMRTAVDYHAPAKLDNELKLTVVVETLGRGPNGKADRPGVTARIVAWLEKRELEKTA